MTPICESANSQYLTPFRIIDTLILFDVTALTAVGCIQNSPYSQVFNELSAKRDQRFAQTAYEMADATSLAADMKLRQNEACQSLNYESTPLFESNFVTAFNAQLREFLTAQLSGQFLCSSETPCTLSEMALKRGVNAIANAHVWHRAARGHDLLLHPHPL